jgi:hypothetical protein
MAPTIRNMLAFGELRRTLFVNAHNKDDYTRHRGQVLYGMTLSGSGTTISIAPGAVYTSQGLRIYFDVTDGSVNLATAVPDAFNTTFQNANLPYCVMVYLSYEFTADQIAQAINVTTAIGQGALFTLSARIVPFDMNTGAPVYNLLPVDPIYLDVSQPSNYTSLQNWNGDWVSAPTGMNIQQQAIQFGEIPLGYVLLGVNPANNAPPTNLTSAGVSIVSYDNAFNMIADLIGQDPLLPLQPNDITYTLVTSPAGLAQYQGYSAREINETSAPSLVRPYYGTPNAVDGSHLDSNWATYRQPNFLQDGTNVLEAFRRMDVVLRQWLDFTGNQSLVAITQDSAATAAGNLPLQASVDNILAVFDGGLTAVTNVNTVVWPNVTSGLDTGNPTNRTVKGGLIPHVENTVIGKLGTNEGDSIRSAVAALDTALFVTLTAALGVSATRAQLRNPATATLAVNLPVAATVPTVTPGSTSNTQIANTAFVHSAIFYDLANAPALGTTTPATAVTNATASDASTQVATDAFVHNAIVYDLAHAPALGTVSPATAVTNATATDSTTQVATDAFVQNAIAYVLAHAPALGTTSPATAVTNVNPMDTSLQVATDAFVQAAIAASPSSWWRTYGPGSASFGINSRAGGATTFTNAIVIISATAGGGGGAGDNSGSGAAGAGCDGLTLVLGSSDTITITVGAAGSGGGPSSSGNPGGNTTIQVTSVSFVIVDAILEGGQGGVYNAASPDALGGRVLLGKTLRDASGYSYIPATAYYSNDGQDFSGAATNTCSMFGPWTTGQNGTANTNNSGNVAHSGGDSIFGRAPVGGSIRPAGSGGAAGPNAGVGSNGGPGLLTVTVIGIS